MTLAAQTFQRAHPDASGPVSRARLTFLAELRVLDILGTTLNAQLAASPLIPPAAQDVADRLDVLWTDAAGVTPSAWTSDTPPPVDGAHFFNGDILETLDASLPSALIVTSSIPAGADVSRGALGPMNKDDLTLHVLYTLPYAASRRRQAEALTGACAVADILQSVRQDPATLWTDGKVTRVERNTPNFGGAPRFVIGLVTFACTLYIPYTAAQQPSLGYMSTQALRAGAGDDPFTAGDEPL